MNKIPVWMFLLLCIAGDVIAQDSCELSQTDIWTSVMEVCSATARNELCYGNALVTAEARNTDFVFEQAGDIVSVEHVESMTLSPFDDGQVWGIVLMQLQANLPDALPEQNVTIVAFGDVTLENQVPMADEPLAVNVAVNARMRRTPDTSSNANVLVSVPAGVVLDAVGRDDSAIWVYTTYGEHSGWISTQVLQIQGDVNNLPVIEGHIPDFQTPMQAFYLRTGSGQVGCDDVPPDGILFQTSEGAGSVNFEINQVTIEMGSTLFVTSTNSQLQVYVLEGVGIVTALDVTQVIPAGTVVSVQLDDSGTMPVEPPSPPQPYDTETLKHLPVGLFNNDSSVLPDTIVIADPLEEDAIDEAIQVYFSGLGLEAGTYSITRVEATIRNGSGNCPPDATFTLAHDGNPDVLFSQYQRLPDGHFGASVADLDAARNSDPAYIGTADQITLTSATTFTWFSVSNGNGDAAYCEFQYEGVRIGS